MTVSENTNTGDGGDSGDAGTDEDAAAPLAAAERRPGSPFTLPGFFDALAGGRLLAAACVDCGTRLVPPRPACYDCGGRDLRIERHPETG